jgi:flagellum-specific peptidoglycan hydrolase FlgJ
VVAASQSMRVTPYAATGVDSSSPEAFIRSIAPYAQRVSQATGIPAEALIGMACNETGYGRYAEGNNLFGIKGTGPAGSFSTQTWEDYGDGRVTIVDNFRGYHSVAESFVDFAKLVTTSERYRGAMGQTTVEGFVDGLRRGGYMTDPEYVQKISAISTHYSATIKESLRGGGAPLASAARATAAPAVRPQATPGGPSAGVKVPDQFNVGLAADEAYAACGPVAAVAFAQAFGRNPTPAEALALAKESGWTAAGGMNGISNEKRLLDKMQLPSRLEFGANWEHIQADALRKQPVILSTPGHYFVIDGYDPSNGAYHVGQSGKVYRGGSEWMTPGQIEAAAGSPNGALFTDHPLVGGDRQVLPPVQVEGQRQVLPPLQVAGQQRPVLPPLMTAGTAAASSAQSAPSALSSASSASSSASRSASSPAASASSPAPSSAAASARPIAPREVLAADPAVLSQLQSAPTPAPSPPAPAPSAPSSLDAQLAAVSPPPPAAAPAQPVETPQPAAPPANILSPAEAPQTPALASSDPIGDSGQLTPREPIPPTPPSRARDPWALTPDVAASAGTPEPFSGSDAGSTIIQPLPSALQQAPPPPIQARPRTAGQSSPSDPDAELLAASTMLDMPSPAPVPTQPAPADKSTVLSPAAEAGLALGAVSATTPDSRKEPEKDPRRSRRPDEDDDFPPPPSPAVEDRAPKV